MYFIPRTGIFAAMRKRINDNSKQTATGSLSTKKTGKESIKTKSSFVRGSIFLNKRPPASNLNVKIFIDKLYTKN
jgi:hypothetical protein